ncbi:KilA-N domain-containing protein [Candidatus Peregrinibacteria bacterium]|nr:KilA-N domain-containing protein [Candidatus Peregrinibacteria bacterium]
MKQKKINVQGTEIVLLQQKDEDYISLTDMVRNINNGLVLIEKWLRNKNTIEFIGIWEQINNPNFNSPEFGGIKDQAGLNRFTLSVKEWILKTNSIGIVAKAGRYGGTYAHKDIAFEFASWISPEFKLYLIKEFQRLKEDENRRLTTGWNVKRTLAKVNYRIHTDAIKEYIIPKITLEQANITYANEADVLNKALFGLTAKEWEDSNPGKKGNIRDYADVVQLVCLSNLESLNAEFIREGLPQDKRLMRLNETAIFQMKSLIGNPSIKVLKNS